MLREALPKIGTYSVASFSQRLASLILIPVYTRYLTPKDYGVMAMVDTIISLFGLFVSVKLAQSLFYHWTHAASDAERNQYLGNAFTGACIAGLVGAGIGWITSPIVGPWLIGVPGAAYYLVLTFATFACDFPIDIGLSLMRIRNQAMHYTVTCLVRLGLGIALNIIFIVFLKMGLVGMLLGALVPALLTTAYLGLYVLRGLHFQLSWTVGRELAKYSLPLLISGACLFVINSADRLFLRWYVSLEEVGLYSLGYKLGMLVSYVQSPVETYWFAQMYEVLRRPEGKKQFSRLLTYVVLYLAAVVIGLTLFIGPVSSIVLGADFRAAMKYTPWVALACLIRAVASMGRSPLFVTGHTRLDAKVTMIGALICLAGYALLIPRYGSWGAVAATLTGFTALLVVGQIYSQKLWPFRFEVGRLARIAVCMAAVVVLGRWIPQKAAIWPFLTAAAVMAAFPVLLFITGFFHADERRQIAVYWKRLLGERV